MRVEAARPWAVSAAGGDALKDKARVVLVLTLDMGRDRLESIEIRANDDVHAVAARFCEKHSLEPPLKHALGTCLEKHLSQLHINSSSAQPKQTPSGTDLEAAAPQRPPARRRARRRRNSARVFERLYHTAHRLRTAREEALRRREEEARASLAAAARAPTISWVSAELTKGRTAAPFANYGERLYAEGRLAMQERATAAEAYRAAQDAEEMEQMHRTSLTQRQLAAANAAAVQREAGVDGPAPTDAAAGSVSARHAKRRANSIGKVGPDAWQRLNAWWDEVKELQLAERRADKLREEEAACTFCPDISQRSREIAETRGEYMRRHRLGLKLHEELFQDAERRRIRQEEYSRWLSPDHTFRPSISPLCLSPTRNPEQATRHHNRSRSSRQYLDGEDDGGGSSGRGEDAEDEEESDEGDHSGIDSEDVLSGDEHGPGQRQAQKQEHARLRNRYGTAAESEDVVERLLSAEREREHRLAQATERALTFDAATGQPLFRPRISRPPKFQHHSGDLPIHEVLHNERAELDSRQRRLEATLRKQAAVDSVREYAGPRSQVLYERMKRRRIYQIFQALDEDMDGSVDLNAVDLTDFDPEIKADVEAAAAVVSSPISAEEFQDVMDFVLGGGTGWAPPRGYLMPSAHRRPQEEHYPFVPALNPRSSKLALLRRPGLGAQRERGENLASVTTEDELDSFFESLYREREEWIYKTAQMRERLAAAEMAECTFAPRMSVDRQTAKRLTRRRQQRQRRRAQMQSAPPSHPQQQEQEQEHAGEQEQEPEPHYQATVSDDDSTAALEEQLRRSLDFPLLTSP